MESGHTHRKLLTIPRQENPSKRSGLTIIGDWGWSRTSFRYGRNSHFDQFHLETHVQWKVDTQTINCWQFLARKRRKNPSKRNGLTIIGVFGVVNFLECSVHISRCSWSGLITFARGSAFTIHFKFPPKIQKRSQKNSKQFLKNFLRFWKYSIPYIAFRGPKPFGLVLECSVQI